MPLNLPAEMEDVYRCNAQLLAACHVAADMPNAVALLSNMTELLTAMAQLQSAAQLHVTFIEEAQDETDAELDRLAALSPLGQA